MDKQKNIPFKKNESENVPGRTVVHYRWMFVLIIIPLFYFASRNTMVFGDFVKIMVGISIYNLIVNMFMLKVYPKTLKIPDYIYYIDSVLVSFTALIFGGLNSDVYLIYLFIIASFCTSNSIARTMKFSGTLIAFYSAACIVQGVVYVEGWLFGQNIMILFMRDISLIIITYGIGLLIVEARKADNLHKREFERARTDRLTGLPNRHYMEQRLVEELADCDLNDKVMNVLIFDLDNFKKFNDTYGHTWGDELLKKFASIIRQGIRKVDIPIRYGGEEFVVLVKDIDFTTAKSVANRVRRQLEMEKIMINDGQTQKRVTVSCGVAQYPTHSKDIKKVIEMADKALYGAKEKGKNNVFGYDEFFDYQQIEYIQEIIDVGATVPRQ